MNGGLEIERKYLIRMPDEAALRARPDCQIWHIIQTYLRDGIDGSTRRVRILRKNGVETCFYTCKRHINALSQQEDEKEISSEKYCEMLKEADTELKPINKCRYRIPFCGQLLEIDIYSFWNDRATLEIELENEEQKVVIPEWISVVREVTADRAYKNNRLAKFVPMEDID